METTTTSRQPQRTDDRYCQSECPACAERFQEDLTRYLDNTKTALQNAQAAFTAAREAAERAGAGFTILGRSLDYWSRLDKLVRTERPDLARKAETPPREYLFLGGPVHGKKFATELETYRVPAPITVSALAESWPSYPEPRFKAAIYRRRQVAIADRGDTVYTYEGTN